MEAKYILKLSALVFFRRIWQMMMFDLYISFFQRIITKRMKSIFMMDGVLINDQSTKRHREFVASSQLERSWSCSGSSLQRRFIHHDPARSIKARTSHCADDIRIHPSSRLGYPRSGYIYNVSESGDDIWCYYTSIELFIALCDEFFSFLWLNGARVCLTIALPIDSHRPRATTSVVNNQTALSPPFSSLSNSPLYRYTTAR